METPSYPSVVSIPIELVNNLLQISRAVENSKRDLLYPKSTMRVCISEGVVSASEALAELEQILRDHTLHGGSARCFGWFSPSVDPAVACSDLLVSLYNPQLAVRQSSPGAYDIEDFVLSTFANWMGIESFKGLFTTGGAESNTTAVVLAKSKIGERISNNQSSLLMLYASTSTHQSIVKSARINGILSNNIAWIPTDKHGQMCTSLLESRIMDDVEKGKIPLMIVANIGTTAEGGCDDLPHLTEISAKYNAWLHVDAAWGGGALIAGTSELTTDSFDSIAIDAHKMFPVPLVAGMLWVKDKTYLSKAFQVSDKYDPENLQENLFENSLNWSRRFLGARLFILLKTYGRNGLQALVRKNIECSKIFYSGLNQASWEILGKSVLPVVCFRPRYVAPNEINDVVSRICVSVNRRGNVSITSTVSTDGYQMLRVCFNSQLTNVSDVHLLIDELETAFKLIMGTE